MQNRLCIQLELDKLRAAEPRTLGFAAVINIAKLALSWRSYWHKLPSLLMLNAKVIRGLTLFPILILAVNDVDMLLEMKARRMGLEGPASVGVSDAFGYTTEGNMVRHSMEQVGKEAVQCL